MSGGGLVTTPAFSDTDVENNTTYFYVVYAFDLAGNKSVASNEVYGTPRVPNTTNVKVDFTATNGVPAAGYVADWGQAFGPRTSTGQGSGLTYGWEDEDGHPTSLVSNGRDRNRAGIDERLDSMIHMQYHDVDGGNGTSGVHTDGVWELAVPNGLYEVTVAVGDQPGANVLYDSQHAINVEGVVGIETFQATAADEFRTVTLKVGVWDEQLTIDALGGFNTKLAYVDVKGLPFDAPHMEKSRPENRSMDADPSGVSLDIRNPVSSYGVDDTTIPGNVHLYKVSDGSEIPGTYGSTGGNDAVGYAPNAPLLPNTMYRFVLTSGVKDALGNPFVPATIVFTTGAGATGPGSGEFKPLTNIAFEKVELPIGQGKYWSSFNFGPDGKLYGSTIGQGLFRFTVNADGTLSNMEDLGYQGIGIIGLLWDKSASAGNLKLWITNVSADLSASSPEWSSGISLLTGPNLQNQKHVFSKLPRSSSDHLTNSMIYGPNDDIYVLQGSNQAAGDLDSTWGQRGEQVLTAALLHFDPDNARVQQSINDAQGDDPLPVKTIVAADQPVAYDPWAPTAPLKIYATRHPQCLRPRLPHERPHLRADERHGGWRQLAGRELQRGDQHVDAGGSPQTPDQRTAEHAGSHRGLPGPRCARPELHAALGTGGLQPARRSATTCTTSSKAASTVTRTRRAASSCCTRAMTRRTRRSGPARAARSTRSEPCPNRTTRASRTTSSTTRARTARSSTRAARSADSSRATSWSCASRTTTT